VISALKQLVTQSPSIRAAATNLRYPHEAWAQLLPPRNPDDSGPVVFTMQKCASTFVSKALAQVCEDYGKRAYNYASLYWGRGETDVYRAIQRDADRLFIRPNAVYGSLRKYVEMPGIDRRPVVLMLRDPRDVLVSSYYSVAFSHAAPGGEKSRARFEAKRAATQSITIDRYVLETADTFRQVYREYADKLLGRDNVTFVTYEELIADPAGWSTRFVAGLGFEPREDTLARLQAIYDDGRPKPGENRTSQHRRSGEAEQFRTYLEPATLAEIDGIYADELRRFGCWPALNEVGGKGS
jgi:hypothetical protein